MRFFQLHRRSYGLFFLSLLFLWMPAQAFAQQSGSTEGRALYDALKQFGLKGKASVSNLTLKRDRAEMKFTGDFYFAAPINGKITGAVFIGTGTFRAEAPAIPFEKENMKRYLNAEVAESDFKTAVLRFSDDTVDLIGKGMDASAAATSDAQKLATEMETRMLKETGANISSRLLISLSNNESPGIFFAQFDKGTRSRFTLLIDPQARIPGSSFGINGGEKVLVFSYAPYAYENDMWIATYSEEDFSKNRVNYSDQFDLVSPLHYKMEIDLREARRMLHTKMRIDFESLADNLRTIPMLLNDGLTEFDNVRLKDSMKIKSAQFSGQNLPYVQEDWESGFTLILPKPAQKGEKFSVDLSIEGDFIDNQTKILNGYYPQSNESWYPRHGYLKRSTFDLTFRHRNGDNVASIGKLMRENEQWPDAKDDRLTQFIMDKPVALATFAAGLLKRTTEKRKLSFGELPLDVYALPSTLMDVKEDFILAEMGNVLNYFSTYFGPYPYDSFRSTFHPFNFGQGFPTLLLIPKADEANRLVFSFLAHETAHQWWGHVVLWRSYRDQWLSEGFAEYSGMLYTGFRQNMASQKELIKESRYVLPFPPETDRGVGKGKVAEIGPLILGRRLATRNTQNAYSDLIYNKGALVLRMLHFLFTDPNTGQGQPFFNMMSDFVKRFQNKAATTEDFMAVAGAHFANTPIAKSFGLKDLGWFFQQWVFEAKLPSYRLEYRIESGENNQALVKWTAFQENAGQNWFMPLPVVVKFSGDQVGRTMVYVQGPQTSGQFALPSKPNSVELDPDFWILTEKTSTKKQ